MIGLGLIGCGAWGINYLKTLSLIPDAEVLYICDLDEITLKKAKLAYPHLNVTTSYRDLLEDEKVRGVIIATPPKAHLSIASDSLNHKKAVLVEKPATLSYVDAKMLVESAQKNNSVLMAGHLMEYHPAIVKLKEYINQGVLGELRYILLERANPGKNRTDVSVLWDLAVHDLSIVRFLVEHEPKWVSAQGESYLHDGIHDLVTITLGFPKDLFVQIHANWMYPVKKRQIIVAGNKMSAVLYDIRENFELLIIAHDGDIIIPKLEETLPLTSQCLHYIECIKHSSEPKTGSRDILWILKVMELVEQSLCSNGVRLNFSYDRWHK